MGPTDFEGRAWDELLTQWLGRVPPAGRFRCVDGLVAPLEDLTAADHVESDPLDLGFLSDRPAS